MHSESESKVAEFAHLAYRPDVDGLRAIAVLGVVFFHAFPHLLPGGFAGVDVFFVISGYLISALILQDIGRAQFSIKSFYARRIRRIFPVLLTMLFTVWLAGCALLNPGELRALGQSMVHSSYFANNFLLYTQAGYFDTDAELKPLLHLWSLAVEEQFYIIWPWALWLAVNLRSTGRWLPLLLAVPSLLACIFVTETQPVAAFFLPHYRGWELLTGAIAAIYGGSLRELLTLYLGRWREFVGLIGILLIFLAYIAVNGTQPYPGWRAFLPVAGAFLVILSHPKSAISRCVLGARPMVSIGLISYPLYLWHWPLFSFARILYGEPSNILLLALLIAAFVLAWVSYRFLEMPIRHSPQRVLRSAWVPVAGLLLLIALGGIGDWTRSSHGFPWRVDSDVWRSLDWGGGRILDPECARALNPVGNYCQRTGQGKPTLVLMGDSHANHFFPGLSKLVAAVGGNLLQVEGPLHMDSGKNWDNVAWINSMPTVRTVYIAYHFGRLHQKDNPFDGVLTALIERLSSAGKQVVFVIDNPEFDFDPRLCTERPPPAQWLGSGGNVDKICQETIIYMRRKREDYEGLVSELKKNYPSVGFIDMFSPFCDETRCSALFDGGVWYRDRHHLTVLGSEQAFAILARQLGSIPGVHP